MVAWNWVKGNQQLFAAKVLPPDIISVDEDNAAMAVCSWLHTIWMRMKHGLPSFSPSQRRYGVFMHDIRDKRDIRVSCMCNTD
uniref:Si:ch211-209j12.2 n=2 Tax=Nothobranchius kuhntae TaxID=321403 RepID=A0A1A8HVW2_NOTKU